MNTARMSIQELIDLKPSMDNPIELVCDDGDYQNDLFRIKVIGIYKERVSIINNNEILSVICENELEHYPSFNQPKKRNLEVFYEAIDQGGVVSFFNKSGSWSGSWLRAEYDGVVSYEAAFAPGYYLIPNGRKLIYDHDTKELLAWDEELMK